MAVVSEENSELPKRVHGRNLPPAAYRAVGIARVPIQNVTDEVWRLDEQTMRVVLNGLRRWQVTRP